MEPDISLMKHILADFSLLSSLYCNAYVGSALGICIPKCLEYNEDVMW
jgi:hypothetical protein